MRLFVGQIPREWTEFDVQALFSQYGELQETMVLRHPDTLISKGCAFVTFSNDESALKAIEELHDKFSPSEGRKIQVRDSTAPRTVQETGRLYCSNLAETTTGNQLFDMFSEVGRVLSVSILMTPYNRPKCSCLVEMATRTDALAVIEKFNGRIKLPNAPTEMTVTWARNTGSKNKTGSMPQQQMQQLIQQYHQQQQQQQQQQQFVQTPAVSGQSYQQQPMYVMGPDPSSFYGVATQQPPPPQPAGYYPPMMYYDEQIIEEEKTDDGPNQMYVQGMQQQMEMQQYQMSMHPQPYVFVAVPVPAPGGHSPLTLPPSSPLVSSPMKSFSRHRSSSSLQSSPTNRYREGPVGANLFVKNFPLEWDRFTLYQLFDKFGDIVSCNIFMDRVTGKSRGFGFVSFMTREQANVAIANLNGIMVAEGQQLVVEVKLKELSGSYGYPHSNNSSAVNVLDTEELFAEDEQVEVRQVF